MTDTNQNHCPYQNQSKSTDKQDKSVLDEQTESEPSREELSRTLGSSSIKNSTFGGKVRLLICSPESIFCLDLNKILMYLLVIFAALAEVGHKIVDSLSLSER